MSGHSKWANIKHRKGANDKKRAKLNTKLIKEIHVATKLGGADEANNPRLKIAKINAKSANISKDTIEKAIKKASGVGSVDYQTITYEGVGPFGVGVIVETMTDNINRTVSIVRSIFSKHGGQLGKNGSLSYLFERKGIFLIDDIQNIDEDEFILNIIDAGAEDVKKEDEEYSIICNIEDFGKIQKEIEKLNLEPSNAELVYLPKMTAQLGDQEKNKFLKYIEAMEDEDDVQKVYHNLD